jgi:predicted dehydrogenase
MSADQNRNPNWTSATSPNALDRRTFLKTSSAAAAGGALVATLGMARSAHAAGDDLLRVGLIGCGGRGRGAAVQALKADPNVKLTAMGDAFADRLESSLESLQKNDEVAAKIDVPRERRFVGFDAYKQVIESGVDVVLLATPPHFRPMHLEAAIAADKHVFAEKPVAVDAPGVRRVLATCAEAEKKGLSIVSGLCLRYSQGFGELVARIHDGQIGKVHTLFANDYRGPLWLKERQPDWTDMHWQMRNWYYFTWLSGDFNVEQHVHYLDVCAWAMGDRYPARAIGMGGRQVRTGPEYGNIFDHHSVVYTYDDGTKLVANTRQMAGCKGDMSAHAVGSLGAAQFAERRRGLAITGEMSWAYDGPDNDIYQTEHDELFASIRSARPINNGQYMAHSTMLAILGRMATYTGQEITWDEAMMSTQDLSPERYEWGAAPPVEIAVPGVTKFF